MALIRAGRAQVAKIKGGIVIHAEHLRAAFVVPLRACLGGINIKKHTADQDLRALRQSDRKAVQIEIYGAAADTVILLVPARIEGIKRKIGVQRYFDLRGRALAKLGIGKRAAVRTVAAVTEVIRGKIYAKI